MLVPSYTWSYSEVGALNDFCEKSPVDWVVRVKIFVKVALSCSVSEINAFLCLTQKFKMAGKSGGKTFFGEIMQVDSADTLWVKYFLKSLYLAPFPR